MSFTAKACYLHLVQYLTDKTPWIKITNNPRTIQVTSSI